MALAVAEAAQAHDGLVVVVARDNLRAHLLEDELAVFAGSLPVLHFPDWDTLPYDLFSPHPEIVSQRIATLYRLPATRRGVLIVPVTTLMQRLAPQRYIGGSGLSVRVGQRFDLAAEQRRLQEAGYRHVPQVGEPGDFAVRGALIDIFPMGTAEPYRIELFDEDVESIRSFEVETQRSQHTVEAVELLPAREFPLTDEASRDFRNRLRERFPIDVRRCPLYQDMKDGVTPAGIEYYLPMFFESTETLFDYIAGDALFVLGENALESAETFWQQTAERYDQRAHDIERPILPPAELYLAPDQLRERLNGQLRADMVDSGHAHAVALGTQPAPNVPLNARGEEPAAELKRFLGAYPGRVLLIADSAGRRETLGDQLAVAGIRPTPVDNWQAFVADAEATPFAITVAPLEQGFALTRPALTVLTERELFGERVRQDRRRRRGPARDPDTIIRDLTELGIGAPIVHIDHGVGRYQGLVSLYVAVGAAEGGRGEAMSASTASMALSWSGVSSNGKPLAKSSSRARSTASAWPWRASRWA
jgi:transcription-repair coupling factor (superfamily II helicase)